MAATTIDSSSERIDYAATLSERAKLLIMLGVLLGLFLEALDQTIVATALPRIVSEFQGINLVAWVSTGYLLASTALVPIYGKLSDVLGRRAIVIWGIVVFLIGSVLCGIAGSMIQLVIFRVIQGIGAAALASTAFAIPADLYPPAERARATGLIGATFGIASILGPLVGGFLTDGPGWRWAFFVNIPFGILALAVILTRMPKLNSGQRDPIDWLGTGLLLLAVVPLLLGLSLDKTLFPWNSPLIIGLFVAALVAGVALIAVERRVASPVIALPLFRIRAFGIVSLLSFLFGLAILPSVLFLPLFLVNVVGVSATAAGSALIPQTLGLVATAIIGANIVQRTGRYKPLILAGLALSGMSFVLLGTMGVNTSLLDVTWRMVVLGIGLGCAIPLLPLAGQNAVSYRDTGSATANIQFFQQIGGVLGSVIAGAILAAVLTSQFDALVKPAIAQLPPAVQQQIDLDRLRNGSAGSEGAPAAGATPAAPLDPAVAVAVRQSFATSITTLYLAAAVLAVAALLVALTLPEIPLRTTNNDDPVPIEA
ncbi:MAG: MFS transporter [Roseiflexaceae bacterium]|nr:MFS transporter [Roseiflexaceae bacterium]